MNKYTDWLTSFDQRDLFTAQVFGITALLLLVRHFLSERTKRIVDPLLGGLYSVAFILVTACFRPTL